MLAYGVYPCVCLEVLAGLQVWGVCMILFGVCLWAVVSWVVYINLDEGCGFVCCVCRQICTCDIVILMFGDFLN